MTCNVHPFVLATLLDDPQARNARFLAVHTRECGDAVDALTNVVQFRAYGKEFALAGSFGLADGNETFSPVVEFDGLHRSGLGCRTRRRDEGDSVGPSYTDQQRAKATQRIRRWDTTRCVIEMDGSSGGNRQWAKRSDPKFFVRKTRVLSSHRTSLRAQSRYGVPMTDLEHPPV